MVHKAQCWKDDAVIIMGTLGTLLNDELKILPSSILIIEGQAEFGANATTAKKNIPINLFVADNILFTIWSLAKRECQDGGVHIVNSSKTSGNNLATSAASHGQLQP
jgi:hypothetical protein